MVTTGLIHRFLIELPMSFNGYSSLKGGISMSKTVILSCPTLGCELKAALAAHHSEAAVFFLPRRLHNDPKELHSYVQDTIDNLYNIDRVVLCVSGCGGAAAGLRASSAELIIPRTRDCLDILLSAESLASLQRDITGVYYTASWMEFSKNSEIDLDKLTAKMGREEAEKFLRNLYKTFNKFYIIDTGCYDLKEVRDYVTPLVKILEGTVTTLQGKYGILHKIAQERFDEDFLTVEKGGTASMESFLKNR